MDKLNELINEIYTTNDVQRVYDLQDILYTSSDTLKIMANNLTIDQFKDEELLFAFEAFLEDLSCKCMVAANEADKLAQECAQAERNAIEYERAYHEGYYGGK